MYELILFFIENFKLLKKYIIPFKKKAKLIFIQFLQYPFTKEHQYNIKIYIIKPLISFFNFYSKHFSLRVVIILTKTNNIKK